MKLKNLKVAKGVSMLHLVVVMLLSGIMIFGTFKSIANNNARKKVEETMPKTSEYIEFNRSVSLVWQFCKNNTETDEMVSDELCYRRLKTFESCQNLKNNINAFNKLEKLVSLIENEQQAEAIINKCQTYKEEISKKEIAKNENDENDEKMNEMLNSLF